jgi:hypothetical protein
LNTDPIASGDARDLAHKLYSPAFPPQSDLATVPHLEPNRTMVR